MKPATSFLRVIAVGLIVGMFAVAAHADSVKDPKIIIRDPWCQGESGCTPVGTNFTFTTPASGTGALYFTNASGVDWFNLKLVETGVSADVISCLTDLFANCAVSTVNGITTILLSGLSKDYPGIVCGQNFSIVFGCVSGKCDPWPGNMTFIATANVPEPGTMALLFTGIGAIVARRRKLRKRSQV